MSHLPRAGRLLLSRSSLVVTEENAPSIKWINVGMTVSRFYNAVDHSPAASRQALTDVLEGLGALHLPG